MTVTATTSTVIARRQRRRFRPSWTGCSTRAIDSSRYPHEGGAAQVAADPRHDRDRDRAGAVRANGELAGYLGSDQALGHAASTPGRAGERRESWGERRSVVDLSPSRRSVVARPRPARHL